jgi:hypothetical protein
MRLSVKVAQIVRVLTLAPPRRTRIASPTPARGARHWIDGLRIVILGQPRVTTLTERLEANAM